MGANGEASRRLTWEVCRIVVETWLLESCETVEGTCHEFPIVSAASAHHQVVTRTDALMGEESGSFIENIDRVHATWQAVPKTYEIDGQGRTARTRLHLFIGGCARWMVEKDVDSDGAGQVQASGVADFGMGRELGYISIPELLENGAELDLYFKPRPIAEILS